MSWTSATDIRTQLERHWKRGDILRALVQQSAIFPMRLRIHLPTTREVAAEYLRAQQWVAMLRELPGTRLEYRSVRSRLLGMQEYPSGLWVDTAEDAVAYLQVQPTAECYLTLYAATADALPELLPWLYANPLNTVALERSWEEILRVLAWRKLNPVASPIYIRQADVPGVDTKFIERNTVVLSDLFDLLSPPREIANSSLDFRERFGFLREPARIRFRILDPSLHFAGLPGCPDVELDEGSFALLHLSVQRVFITENKTNVLAFPLVPGSIVIFGAGYGMRAIGRARWISGVPLFY